MNNTSCIVCAMKKDLSETCHIFFSTLANPARLATLENLMEGPRNVSEIADALKLEQSMVSHNLKPLVRCGFVHIQKKGKERIYHLNRETFEAILNVIENHAQKYCPTGGRCQP